MARALYFITPLPPDMATELDAALLPAIAAADTLTDYFLSCFRHCVIIAITTAITPALDIAAALLSLMPDFMIFELLSFTCCHFVTLLRAFFFFTLPLSPLPLRHFRYMLYFLSRRSR